MTRINVVPPKELTDKHLVAEYRELPRVFNLVKARQNKGIYDLHIPDEYCLGKGHVTFFYNKLAYIRNRQISIIKEMQDRGFITNYPTPCSLDGFDSCWINDYKPTTKALGLNRERIKNRLLSK